MKGPLAQREGAYGPFPRRVTAQRHSRLSVQPPDRCAAFPGYRRRASFGL